MYLTSLWWLLHSPIYNVILLMNYLNCLFTICVYPFEERRCLVFHSWVNLQWLPNSSKNIIGPLSKQLLFLWLCPMICLLSCLFRISTKTLSNQIERSRIWSLLSVPITKRRRHFKAPFVCPVQSCLKTSPCLRRWSLRRSLVYWIHRV